MMKQIFKRLLTFSVLGAFCFSMTGVKANAVQEEIQLGFGLKLMSPEEHEASNESTSSKVLNFERSASPLPSSVDLSESPYFPPIGYQGEIGSCVAWTTTYYQYTYEANKLNQIPTTAQNAYSPSWTYNAGNKGEHIAVDYSDCYDILETRGALRMEDCPYNPTLSGYDFSWSTDTEAMVEALNTRSLGNSKETIDTSTDKITSTSDSQLTYIKELLSSGKVLVASTLATTDMANWAMKPIQGSTDVAVYRASVPQEIIGHSITIVGYNDNIKCDVNGNGTIEACEKGAFKVINSWGTQATRPDGKRWANDGWVWVMYDALNSSSANTVNNWEQNETGTRTTVFTPHNGFSYYNDYYYIVVENFEVNLVALVTFTTDYRYNLNWYTNRCSTTTYSSDKENKFIINHDPAEIASPKPYTGTLAFDFGTRDDDIENYLTGYKWFFKMTNDSPGNVRNISYRLVDNRYTHIANAGTVATNVPANSSIAKSITLNMQRGDIDFNGILNSGDAQIMLNHVTGRIVYSNIQNVIGDYNQDGACDLLDVTALNRDLSTKESALFTEYVTKLYADTQKNNSRQAYSANYVSVIEDLYFELTKE